MVREVGAADLAGASFSGIADEEARQAPAVGQPAAANEPVLLSALIAWGACALALTAVFLPHPWSRLAPDPDSLMRLVQVRDLIGGQAWFDTVQHRMNPPDGMPMHWSRLVDAPIAALVAAGTRLFGQSTGEAIALFAWPLALLGGFVLAATTAATAISGRAAAFPAAILAILCVDALTYFIPGRIDHHNVQLILVVAAIAFAARIAAGAAYGIGAGLTLALMLSVGLESLPYAMLVAAGIAIHWAIRPATGTGTIAFGLTFAVALAVFYATTTRVTGAAVCDTLSPVYLMPALVGGIGLAIMVQIGRPWERRTRLAGLAGLAIVAVLPAAALFPQCLTGPYSAVSDELQALWLSGVAEAQTLIGYASAKPAEALGKIGAPALALVIGCRIAKNTAADHHRFGLWLCLGAIALALVLSLAQVRAAPFANVFALPVLAAWIGQVRKRGASRPARWSSGVILVLAWLAATPLSWYGIGFGAVALADAYAGGHPGQQTAKPAPDVAAPDDPLVTRECADRSATLDLAFIAPGRVLSTVFYGPNILAMSGHTVVAGPYHRGEAAILDTVRAMNGTPTAARAIVERRRIDYIVICPTSAETRDTIPEAPDGLLARLVRGDKIPWLRPVAGNSSLMIFRTMI